MVRDAEGREVRDRAEAGRLCHKDSLPTGPSGRPGSCSTEYVRGREAVMAELRFQLALAECEDLCVLPWGDEYGGS